MVDWTTAWPDHRTVIREAIARSTRHFGPLLRVGAGRSFLLLSILAILVPLSSGSELFAQCLYDVTPIEAPGLTATIGTGLNESGHVVGYVVELISGNSSAFRWTPEEGIVYLPMPMGTTSSVARDINDFGQIVGGYDIPSDGFSELGFVYDEGALTTIMPPGGSFVQSYAINNQGQVVGRTTDETPYYKAFVWEEGSMTLLLPTFGPRSRAFDINEEGVVAGWMGTGTNTDAHACFWADGDATDLGPIPHGYTSEGFAINEIGQVGGHGRLLDPEGGPWLLHAFIWSNGVMRDLGTLPGFRRATIASMNDSGEAAGRSWYFADNPNENHAFVYRNGVLIDLDELIYPDGPPGIDDAAAINNAGVILADGDTGTLLLTPLPGLMGDVNIDGELNGADIRLFVDLLLDPDPPVSSAAYCQADMDADGLLTILDVPIFASALIGS